MGDDMLRGPASEFSHPMAMVGIPFIFTPPPRTVELESDYSKRPRNRHMGANGNEDKNTQPHLFEIGKKSVSMHAARHAP